jgi:hypothetical protein
MTSAAAQAISSSPPDLLATKNPAIEPTVDSLQDLLYELLATGLMPEQSDVSAEDIEQFLFEHAREQKSLDEFKAFFEKHALSLDPSEHFAPANGTELSAGFEMPSAPVPGIPVVAELPSRNDEEERPSSQPPALPQRAPQHTVASAPQPRLQKQNTRFGMWVALGAALAMLGLAIGAGISMLLSLQAEIEQTKSLQNKERLMVRHLEQRVDGVGAAVISNAEALQNMGPKIDFLVTSISEPIEE